MFGESLGESRRRYRKYNKGESGEATKDGISKFFSTYFYPYIICLKERVDVEKNNIVMEKLNLLRSVNADLMKAMVKEKVDIVIDKENQITH